MEEKDSFILVNSMVAGELATQGARASVAMVFNYEMLKANPSCISVTIGHIYKTDLCSNLISAWSMMTHGDTRGPSQYKDVVLPV